MHIPKSISILSVLITCVTLAFSQDYSTYEESPVKLEYVVPQNGFSPGKGSFVVKNNFPARSLDKYFLRWILSKNGVEVSSDNYWLTGIAPSETKYIGLKKLFDLQVLDSLGKGLITLQAEVQDENGGYEPIPLIGVSVVLAEAEPRRIAPPEKYHVIKVGGAKIHRIANGNSATLDIFNQLVAIDLGKGNMLAGPVRPVVSFISLSAKQEAQHLIDSLGPSSVKVKKDKLSGVIEYNLDTFGLLKLPFALSESGLSLGIELQGGIELPTALGIEVPLRSLGDTATYLGQQEWGLTPAFGDSRLGRFGIPRDGFLLNPANDDTFLHTRSINTERGDILGNPFTFQLTPIQEGTHQYVGLSSHPMEAGTHILLLNRLIERRYRAKNTAPINGGKWLFVPKGKKD